MDDFVCNKLTEWNLSEWIQTFKDHKVDKESLYCLEDHHIAALIPMVGPQSKFKKRLKLLKEKQNTTDPETSESSVEVRPSTSKTNDKGKRKLDLQGESSQSPARKRPREDIQGTKTEEEILSDVKYIMRYVHQKLPHQDDKLNKFLKNSIKHLETDKREVVGVFGKTGAGKSSLINAVIGEQDLLPSGSISACTSVMIKVEANMRNPKYEAEIEFITKEEWKEELWTLFNFLGDNEDQEKDEDYQDSVEKLSVLYGEEWRNKSPENFMDKKYFREIPEFLLSKSKILTSDTAKELSAKFVKYTRSESKEEDAKDVKRLYWPLVKCVTVRVPKNRLLQHVTLVDLPGNGDRNKSRDRMWKKVVGSCSTVWIVTEINRAASEKESWEILEESCSLMGNGGECQQIHFICTKSDSLGRSGNQSAAGVRAQILKQNEQAKKKVRAEFSKLKDVKKQFSEECFKVFTVSSKEFMRKKRLDPDDTEIPRLQEFLQDLNNSHSETLNYVSGARGILSLIQGASSRGATKKGGAFHMILKCLVQNGGIHKTKKGKLININMKLTSCLTDSIDEEFKKTFPNEGNSGPFNGVINAFSLGTEKLMKKECENVKLQLTFLKTEEEKMKTNLNKLIRERKKTIYSSLTTTIEEKMKPCYDRAKEIRGEGTLKNMRETIEMHVHGSKNDMFAQAKDAMMKQLRDLMLEILEKQCNMMQKSIELSLKTDGVSIPDVSVELEMVKKYYNELTGSPDDDAILCSDSPGQAAALRP
ncbi:nuclear GTPase SLIP-GC-like isoform X4 [Gymnodraco acuticeps]|uniref:Nuclear GTPase SLIP-GC-like isoform X4 n=1 Tax=Gymnodraco acuticeps TaxID=8218 RepID=A0A6P8UTI2_GYMAC|nr:nuclear GTPase SLIP-GC-like isoform X4 [Gymnodraco acuticeps]